MKTIKRKLCDANENFFPELKIQYQCPVCGSNRFNFDHKADNEINAVFASYYKNISVSLYCENCGVFYSQIITIVGDEKERKESNKDY